MRPTKFALRGLTRTWIRRLAHFFFRVYPSKPMQPQVVDVPLISILPYFLRKVNRVVRHSFGFEPVMIYNNPMQYADVALPIKAATRQQSFTYLIPPALLPDIRIGQRVTVPFGRREEIGTIIKLRAQSPNIKGSLREIKKLTDPFPIFDETVIKLAETVARDHGATIGQVLDSAAPAPAPRTGKLFINQTSPERIATVHSANKPYVLYQPIATRWSAYRRLIDRVLSQNKRVLIIMPSHELVLIFAQSIADGTVRPLAMPPTAEKSTYYQGWLEVLHGQHQIIVGTRKSVFLPVPNLGLLIIDKVSEYGYKEEQYPYYHALVVAQERAKLSNAQLVIGDAAPQLEQWVKLQAKQLVSIQANMDKSPEVTIINTSTYKKLFPEILLDRIKQTTEQAGRAAVFYNRKGEGRFYRCRDCETAIYCPRCDTLLSVYAEGDKTVLRCPHCGYETTPPYRCTACQSYRLGSVGLGVNSIAKILREHFPNKKIAVISKDNDQSSIPFDIAICTSQLFYLDPSIQFDLLATVHIDHILHGTNWRTNEEAYLMLARLAERTNHLIIQTSQSEHRVIQAFCRHDIDDLYTNEIAQRRQHGFPPAAPITQLIYTGTDATKVTKEAEKLHQALLAAWPDKVDLIYAPSPLGTGKRRDKYRYQIIIKLPVTEELTRLVPAAWQIDPAPDSIG